jgi:hypothetical protein
MKSLPTFAASVKPEGEEPAKRDYVLHSLKTAQQRARLDVALLEEVSIKLRHRKITAEEAIQELKDERLFDRFKIGGML